MGYKPGKLLSWLIRQDVKTTPVMSIRTTRGDIVHAQRDIHNAFTAHYIKLYKSYLQTTSTDIQAFLTEFTLPQLAPEQQEELNNPILPEEIGENIFSLSNGKWPGPDSLPVEFYKAYSDVLILQLLKVYEAAIEDSALAPTQNEAMLISLLKPGRDPESLGSYRPLALLNTDYKIFASILAKRIAPLVKTLIHLDQNGLVPTRNTSLNIRRLFRIQTYALEHWPRSGCLVLDLEKAFDSLE